MVIALEWGAHVLFALVAGCAIGITAMALIFVGASRHTKESDDEQQASIDEWRKQQWKGE